jgi:hypothetical protein
MRTIFSQTFTILACLMVSVLSIGHNLAIGVPISPPMERVEPDPRFIQYTFPAGTAFQVLLQTPLNTEINELEDPVEVIMDHNLYLSEELVLPKNTRFNGSITQLEKPIQGMDAILCIRFQEILLGNGEKLPAIAHVRTEEPSHIWGGKVTQGTKPVLSTQRVWDIGEYNRIVFAGPRAMGKHIVFPTGEHLTLILEQPLVIVKAKDTD